MKSKVISVTVALGLVCAATGVGDSNLLRARGQQKAQQKAQRKPARYACPMHPDVTSTKPGKCPKCGMALRLVEDPVEASAVTPIETAAKDAGDSFAFSSSRIPDLKVYDQNGNRLSFYSDLIKNRTVAINFIFTTCTTICPPLTATLRRVQQELQEASLNVQLISVTVDPSTDTPERLRDFAAKFKAGPGWAFVTGDQTQIESLLKALGAGAANKNDHTPMMLIGNDQSGYWTRTYGLSPPATLAKLIKEAANHK